MPCAAPNKPASSVWKMKGELLRRHRPSTISKHPSRLRGARKWSCACGLVEDATPGGLHPAILDNVPEVAFLPAPESHLLDLQRSHETPAEEFRTLRTRLNHLQTLQPLHTIVISSPSPAEGKTFTAVNLALAESHLTENRVLLGDFDLRRPRRFTTCSRWIAPPA